MKFKTLIVALALLATALIYLASAQAAPKPWYAHVNGAGKLVCDRGNNGVLGPFATRAACLDAIEDGDDNGGGGDNGGGDVTPPVTTVAPQIDRYGACQLDGQFVDVTGDQFFSGQFTDAEGVLQNIVPANYLDGAGETCDNPVNLGYKATGYLVSDGGSIYLQDTTFDVYPFWVKK